MVGVAGFEPTASKSQTSRATSCATPRLVEIFDFSVKSVSGQICGQKFFAETHGGEKARTREGNGDFASVRRVSLSYSANTIYAPKCGALSTALHPGLLIFARYRILNSYISNFHVLNEDENVRTFRRAQLRTADPVYSS